MLFAAIILAILSIVFYLIPNPLEPVLWTEPFALPALTGSLASNSFLKAAKLYKAINAPESIAIDDDNGDCFAGLSDGRVVRIDKNGNYLNDIYFNSALASSPTQNSTLLEWCKREALDHNLPWNPKGEQSCGRPLGMRLISWNDAKALLFLDAYRGLFLISMTKSNDPISLEHLSGPDSTISSPIDDDVDKTSLLPAKFYNDLDFDGKQTVYFTDSSYKNYRSQNREEVIDGAPGVACSPMI